MTLNWLVPLLAVACAIGAVVLRMQALWLPALLLAVPWLFMRLRALRQAARQ